MENKTGKYLKYAFGEIILVVIGILIALQLNNLNEQRKINNKGKEYIHEIYKELKIEISNILKENTRIIEIYKQQNNYQD